MGDDHAYYNLADIYYYGSQGTKKDVYRAIELYQKAIDLGFPNAMNNLAIVYHYGLDEEGIKKNLRKAIELYENAIKLGEPNAYFNLALIYELGDLESNIERDADKACSLYFQSFSNYDLETSKLRFLYIIENQAEKIVWKTEYHQFWKKDTLSQNQIISLLLISKHRLKLQNKTLQSVLVKGITMNVIKYLCHFSSNRIVSGELDKMVSFEKEAPHQEQNNKVCITF